MLGASVSDMCSAASPRAQHAHRFCVQKRRVSLTQMCKGKAAAERKTCWCFLCAVFHSWLGASEQNRECRCVREWHRITGWLHVTHLRANHAA